LKFNYLLEQQVGCCNCDKYERGYIIYWYYSSPYCVDCWCNLMDYNSARFVIIMHETFKYKIKKQWKKSISRHSS
jgi:hypothetical protein